MTAVFPRSFLFVPGDRPTLVASAFRSSAEAIVFDLEDSVTADRKTVAREAIRSACTSAPAGGAPLFVRINGPQSAHLRDDIRAFAGIAIAGFVIPKVEWQTDVRRVVAEAEGTPVILLVETPRGILRALDLAESAERSLVALAFGAEDFCAAMHVDVTAAHPLLAFARAAISAAAAAVGAQAIDAPELQLEDDERLRSRSGDARALGFSAKFAIHPKQLAIIHEVFAPTTAEREWAEEITRGYEQSRAEGRGSARVGGRMVDEATVKRARTILERRRT